MTSGRSPDRLAAILSLYGCVADEIVVAVEEPQALATHEAVAEVADRVLSFPPTGPADRPIAWLFGECTGRWIFNVDDDEIPSPALVERLPELIARDDITHAWIARRWLYPTTTTYLDESPWNTEFQLRLVVSDDRFLQFSDAFHRPVIAHGPCAYVDSPIWHLDTAVNAAWRRRAKAEAYELERPGMKIGGRAHNHALYVPEFRPDVRVGAVPSEEQAQIDRVLAGRRGATRATRATLVHASSVEVDRRWPGVPHSTSLERGRIAVSVTPATMRAGVQDTIDAVVTNDGDVAWRWGNDARPEIRIGYRWTSAGAPVAEPSALRTALPSDIVPGASQLVPVHVVSPTEPGRYALELHVLHEGVATFASTSPFEIEVEARRLLAIAGRPDVIARTMALVAPPPDVEPVVVLGNEAEGAAYGDYLTVTGFRPALLAGLESSGLVARAVKLWWRSRRIVRKARLYRRSRVSHDLQLADSFELLERASCLAVAGTDWPPDAAPGREWWRLVTTMRACRAMGHDVFVAEAAVPQGAGIRSALLRHLVRRNSRPLGELSLGAAPVAALVPVDGPTKPLVDALI